MKSNLREWNLNQWLQRTAGIEGEEQVDASGAVEDETLGLLAVSTVPDDWPPFGTGTPAHFDALAALPQPERAALCREYRRLVALSHGQH